jgi:hypothetical protein
MAASPFPPSPESVGPLANLSGIWEWGWAALSSLFGAGVMWGATRTTAADHGRRIARLEERVPAAMTEIGEKIDENHREVMRMIVSLAAHKKD